MRAHPDASTPEAPSDPAVRELIGPAAYPLFDALLHAGPFRPEWKYYGGKTGWSLKLFEGKRNLCFIQPQAGGFHVGFALGDAAADHLLDGPAPPALKDMVREAPKYPEGRGVRLTVTAEDDLALVMVLLQAKRGR